jgi:hypothetical protein
MHFLDKKNYFLELVFLNFFFSFKTNINYIKNILNSKY